MAWTYTGNPFPTPWPYVVGQAPPQACIDTVRFLIGDTDASDPQLQDGEIAGLLAQNRGSAYQGAIEAAKSLSAHFARQVDKSVGDLHILASERWKAYMAIVKDLEVQALRHDAPTPYAGGISVADKTIDEDDSDVIAPAFVKGMMDDPGTSPDYSEMTDGYNNYYPGSGH